MYVLLHFLSKIIHGHCYYDVFHLKSFHITSLSILIGIQRREEIPTFSPATSTRTLIAPRSQPTVMAGSDHTIFTRFSFERPSVRLAKQNKVHLKIAFAMSLAKRIIDDTCLVCYMTSTAKPSLYHQLRLKLLKSKRCNFIH